MQNDLSRTLRGAFQRMWQGADSRAKHLIVGTLFLVLTSSGVAALTPFLLKASIDALANDGGSDLRPASLVAFYALAHCLWRSLNEVRTMLLNRADQRVHRELSNRFFCHIMSLPLRFHLDRRTGALSRTLNNGLLGYRVLLHHVITSILPVITELAAIGAVLILLGHPLFLVIMSISVLVYAIAFWIGAIRVSEPAKNASSAYIEAGAVFTDGILNYETVKCFNGESRISRRLLAALQRSEHRWEKLYVRKMENGLVIATIFTLSLGLSLYAAGTAVLQNSMSIGEFVLVNTYVIQLTRPLELIGFAFRDTVQSVAFIERMDVLLKEKAETNGGIDSLAVGVNRGELIFENVSFSYDATRCILKDVDFTLSAGNTLAIVGSSGSGKSSLVRLVLQLLIPTKGQIYIDGMPLSNFSLPALRGAIAVVPQDIVLFNESIAHNIAFGKEGSTEEQIVRAAKVAGAHSFIRGLPDGYATKVGERGLKLSGGEKQRIAIARAAIKEPKIIVFDEATSSLDSKMEESILRNLRKVANTWLIIAHGLSAVVEADEIIVLDQGSAIERGTHGVLLRQGGVYAKMWRAQHAESDQETYSTALHLS